MATPRKDPKDYVKTGRPSKYNPEIAKRICDLISTTTVGLTRLCATTDWLPEECTIRLWRVVHPEFSLQYAQAKSNQADLLAEECLQIADDGKNDWMDLESDELNPGYKLNGEHVQRSRLRIDTRKFLASKLLPKKYGDMRQVEELVADNERYRKELNELREKLDGQNRKEY